MPAIILFLFGGIVGIYSSFESILENDQKGFLIIIAGLFSFYLAPKGFILYKHRFTKAELIDNYLKIQVNPKEPEEEYKIEKLYIKERLMLQIVYLYCKEKETPILAVDHCYKYGMELLRSINEKNRQLNERTNGST